MIFRTYDPNIVHTLGVSRDRAKPLESAMSSFLVTYDLHRVRNYAALLPKLRQLGAVSPAESVWLLNYTGGASSLITALRTKADEDDGLFVVQLAPNADWSARETPPEAIDWLIANFGGVRL